jgi:hypothetical protein
VLKRPERLTWHTPHPLRWALLTAGVAGGSALLAFQLDPGVLRLVVGAAALFAGVAHPVVRVTTPAPPIDRRWWVRLLLWGLQILLSLLALAGIIVGLAVILGRALAGRTDPLPVWWLGVGVVGLCLVEFVLLLWWCRGFQFGVLELDKHRRWVSTVSALVIVAGGLFWLDQREQPDVRNLDETQQARQAGTGLYDIVLVVDPADPVSRNLILAARRDIAAGKANRLFTPPTLTVPYNVAYGLAIPQPRHGDDALWRLIEPPTGDAYELADSLARIPLPDDGSASGAASYGRLLADMLVTDKVRWRSGAQRGVAFALRHLPSVRELDGYLPKPGAVIATADDATKSCSTYLDTQTPPSYDADDSSQPVAWGAALAAHCQRRGQYREWEDHGRPAAEKATPPVALYVLTGEVRGVRAKRWWTWARALDGRFDRPPLSVDSSGVQHADAEQLLRNARDLHLGVPTGDLASLTKVFRPHLHFDSDEKFLPVDVDWVLTKEATRDNPHQVCDQRDGRDDCEAISGLEGLTGQLDEYIDLVGGSRGGLGAEAKGGGPARMYVHVLERGKMLYLDYWWFLRFNGSPWQSELNCLPGLTLAALSCHDHEGDWEGVTVALELINPNVLPDPYGLNNVIPKNVVYEAHGNRARWKWEDVDLGADPDSYATHPVVYSAAGSHASYPAGCKADCTQSLSNHATPDGTFDGGKAWPYNGRDTCETSQEDPETQALLGPCLLGLPSTRDGRLGVLWNAFPGQWGGASCTWIGKVCSLVPGPDTPSRQGRFKAPWAVSKKSTLGVRKKLARYRDAYGAPVEADEPRWPPPRWPPPDGAPQPATPELEP